LEGYVEVQKMCGFRGFLYFPLEVIPVIHVFFEITPSALCR